MCIIVAKQKDKLLPKKEYLKNCFENNSDGVGFMYTNNNKVIIDKGYMTYKSFIKHYDKLCKKYNNFKNKSLVIHFRIGTSGENNKQNCHPYPLTDNLKLLHKTNYTTNIAIAHNGVISDYLPNNKGMNDTQNYIINYIYPLFKEWNNFYKNNYITKGIEKITSSKFAILDNKDNITLIGDFEKDENGVLYSNNRFKTYEYKYSDYYDNYYYNEYYKRFYSVISLEGNWYYSVDGKEFEQVKDRDLTFNYYYGELYENIGNTKKLIANKNVTIYDENGEEILL